MKTPPRLDRQMLLAHAWKQVIYQHKWKEYVCLLSLLSPL